MSSEPISTTKNALTTDFATTKIQLTTDDTVPVTTDIITKSSITVQLLSTSLPRADQLSAKHGCEEKTVYGIKWPKTDGAEQIRQPCPKTPGKLFPFCKEIFCISVNIYLK